MAAWTYVVRVAMLTGFVTAVVVLVLVGTGSTGFLFERAHLQEIRLGPVRRPGRRNRVGWSAIRSGSARVSSRATRRSRRTARTWRALAEQGLPGLIVISAFLVSTLAAAIGNAVSGRETYGIGSAALLGALLRDSREQRRHRHSALAAFLDRGRVDLGRLGASADAQTSAPAGSRRGAVTTAGYPPASGRPMVTRPATGGSSPLMNLPSSTASDGDRRSGSQTTSSASAYRATSWPWTEPSRTGPSMTTWR